MHYEQKSVHSWLASQVLTFLAKLLGAFMTGGWLSTTWAVFWVMGMSFKDQDGAPVQLQGPGRGSCAAADQCWLLPCLGSTAELLLLHPQLEQNCVSVQEYPFPDQNKTSTWHCCGQTCLSMRIWVIGSEPDFLIVLWGNINQRCCVTNYDFCHLTPHSVGKIPCSEEQTMWNWNSKILVFLSACSLGAERRPKPQKRWQCDFWHTTCIFRCHWALCVWVCTGTGALCGPLYVKIVLACTFKKNLSGWDRGVLN